MSDLNAAAREKIVTDFKVVIADAEELLRATANQAGDKAQEMRARLREGLDRAKADLAEMQSMVVDKAKAVSHATDDYVHDNPWHAVGIAAGVSFLIGLLIGRR